MKKIITTFAFSVILFSSVGTSFAQNDGFIIPDSGSVIYNNDQGGNNYGNTVYTDPSFIMPSTGSTVYNYDTNCTWCTTPTVTNNNYGNTVYTDPSFIMPSVGSTVYNYDTNCTWCSQPSAYTTPSISNTSTFTPVNTGYFGGNTYGTNSFGIVNYGQPSYGSINYGYINYGQTGSSWTGVNSCPQGQDLINGSCQAHLVPGQCVYPGYSLNANGCQKRCTDGTLVTYPNDCQTNNVACPMDAKQCPDGSYVSRTLPGCNFAACPISTQCPVGSTFVNGICQINTTVCPTGSTLINNVCQINSTTCPSGSTLVNGICQINSTVCPANSVRINGVCQAPITCPTGTTLQNGVCIGYGTTVCPSGSTLINNVCQINSTTCPSGSSFINGVCQAPITCPSGTSYQNGSCVNNQVMVTCPNGSVVNYLFQCPVTYGQTSYGQTSYAQTNYSYNIPQVVYQTCWDGSVIPNTSICQSQYKMCANGTSISINQTCYVAPMPVYVPPVVIKFNNVVTSVVTQITNTSARCNGIGLIAQGAQSTGWFEYGQTANLGRTTSPAIIGSSATAPFSNVLSNLQPTTTYFCRAVMQNQYGIVKGEIVKFTTNKKVTTYVQPAPIKTAVKKVVKKNEIICSDGSVISVNNQTSAGMLNQGQKLIAVQMEKITGDLTAGGNVSYRLSYKNLSGTSLSGVIIKIVIPEELSLTDVPMGSYDEATHTMTFSQVSVNAYSENVINWSGTVKKEAPVGKTIVTTAYVLYTIPGTQVQDEVTAYTASSIMAGQDIQKVSGANHVIGAGVGSFLPSSLVEWLALIAILFIIFILGRSIAASYRKGDEAHH